MTYQEILESVSKELDIPLNVVKLAYRSYWVFIREKIISLPLMEDLSKEDFDKLKTNFNIPSLGKLNCTYERMIGVKEHLEFKKRLKDAYNKES